MANRGRPGRNRPARARGLGDETGSFGTPIAGFFVVLIFLLVLGLGSNFPRLIATQTALASLAEGAAKDAAVQGCLTSQDLQGIGGKVSALGWDASQLSMNTSFATTAANYDTPVTVTMGYNLPMLVFGQKVTWTWHLAAQGGPVLSQFIQPADATSSSSGCSSNSYSGPTYGQGAMDIALSSSPITSSTNGSTPGDGSTGPGTSGAASLTASASPASVSVDQAVTISGTATLGGSPEPGTAVTIAPSGGGASSTTAVTDASGNYQATIVFDQVGTWTVAVSDGQATAQAQVAVVASQPAAVTVSALSPVTDGATDVVYATITDQNGNPVQDGTPIQISSTDSTDIPTQTLTTTNGEVALGVTWTQVGTWTVTFTAGSATGNAQVTVQPGSAANITLTASPNPVAANPNPLTFSNGGPNMVSNPEFNSGLAGWNPCCNSAGSVTTGSDAGSPSGAAAFVTAPMAGMWQGLAGLVPGQTYVLSAWMDIPNGATVLMGLDFGGGNGSYDYSPSPNYTPAGNGGIVTGTGTWHQYHVWFTYLSGGNGHFHTYSNGAINYQVADVQVVPAFVVSGTVTDSQGNPVAAGTSVTLSSPTDPADFPAQTVVTDSQGRFWAVGNFSVAGSQSIEATSGQASGATTVAVSAGGAAQFSGVNLAPNPATVGSELAASSTLEDTEGNPVSGATVTMSGAGATPATATTTANGTFAVTVVPKTGGSETVTLMSGSASWSQVVTVNQQPAADSVVAWIGSPGTDTGAVEAGTTITVGATVTSNGSAVSGAPVAFSQPLDGNPAPSTCTTASTGECTVTLTLTQAGSDVIEASANGGTGVVDVTVTAGPPALITLSASPTSITAGQSVVLSGSISDRYGNPLGGLAVTLFDGRPADNTTATTNTSGLFSTSMTLTLAGAPVTVTASTGGIEAYTQVTVSPGSFATVELYLITPYVPFNGTYDGTTCTDWYGCNYPAQWVWYAYDAYGNLVTNPGYTATYYVGLGSTYFGTFASGVPAGQWYTWPASFDITYTQPEALSVSIQLYDPPYTQAEVFVDPYDSAGPSASATFPAP